MEGTNCIDAPWPSATCSQGLVCLRDNQWWWHCGRLTEQGERTCSMEHLEPLHRLGVSLAWATQALGEGLSVGACNQPATDVRSSRPGLIARWHQMSY